MKKKNIEEQCKPVELLQLKTDWLVGDAQDRLDIYDISVQIDCSQMEEILNKAIKAERKEEEEPTKVTRGTVYIKKDKSGKYYSVKNIRLYLTDYLEFGFDLFQTEGKSSLIALAIFLFKLATQLGAELTEEQAMVCVALYKSSRHCAITDHNIEQQITMELEESGYGKTMEEIEKIISKLIKLGIVSIEGGRYEVAQKLYFE